MVGDDANLVMVELLKQLLEIIRNMQNKNYYKDKTKAPKQPKIKFGKMSKKDFNKLKKAGNEFKYVKVPKDKLEELEKTAKDLGVSFFATELTEGNNAVIAVPAQYTNELSEAAKYVIGSIMKNDPEAVVIKDGSSKIDEEDMRLVSDILQNHDIPVYSFQSVDGKYINVVPKEFDGQYEAAIEEFKALKKQLDNIEVVRYEQTAPLDSLDFIAKKLTADEAAELSAAAKANNLDVQLAKDGNDIIAYYPKELANAVDKAIDGYKKSLEESDKYLIDVTDDTITMDVEKLVEREDENSYFVRVPNTGALDYLRIDKSDVEVINDGKTLSMKLDMDKTYYIYDVNEDLKNTRKGLELAESYNTKHKHINKDTEVLEYGNTFRRIDLYNAEKNRLISLGVANASEIRAQLIKNGISDKAAENLLRDIYQKMPESYKEIFNYSAEKTEVVYADIPNIGEYLAQSQLSQQVIGKAVCYGEIPQDNGSKCCIYDKNSGKFDIMPVLPRLDVMARLSQMGYSEMSAKEIADKIIGSYRDTDKEKTEEVKQESVEVAPKTFDSNNSELKNFMYHNTGDGTIIVQDKGDQYGYLDIDKGMSAAAVETALLKNFSIKDAISAAEIMKQLAKDGIIETPQPKTFGEITVSQVSPGCIEVSKGEKSAIMPINKLDGKRLTAMGITDNEKTSIENSLAKAEKAAGEPEKQTLQGLKNFAEGVRSKITTVGEKAKEIAQAVRNSGQER